MALFQGMAAALSESPGVLSTPVDMGPFLHYTFFIVGYLVQKQIPKQSWEIPLKIQRYLQMMPAQKVVIAVFTVLLMAGCAATTPKLSPSAAMGKYKSVNELNVRIGAARQAGIRYLAPKGYQDVMMIYTSALDKATAQDAEAEKLARDGLKRLRAALKQAERSKELLREVLYARSKARHAKAQVIYPEKYAEVEKKLMKASMAVENRKIEKAKEMRAELIGNYAGIELDALKTNISRKARAAIAKAEEKEAGKYAPKTLKLAEEQLALTLDILSAGRTQTQKAGAHADRAVYLANKSIYITVLIKDFKRRDFTKEEQVLWYQEQLELINKPFRKGLALNRPNRDVVMGMQEEIDRLIQAGTATERASSTTRRDVRALQKRIDTLTAKYEQEIARLNKKMLSSGALMEKQLLNLENANRMAQARFDKIRSIFTEEEAYVYRQGNNVLLETHAFDFKVGGAEIDSGNFDLLKKIMKAINIFDNPDVIVIGHTDSTGSAALNMKLSQKRARTVASFLKKLGKINAANIDVRGYGEARPVASNETKEGRERNRRIEVSIINK